MVQACTRLVGAAAGRARLKSTSLPAIGAALIGFPLAVIMRKSAGVVRPWFVPLFLDRELKEDARHGKLQPAAGGNAAGSNQDAMCADLPRMATEAALTRAAGERELSAKRQRTSTTPGRQPPRGG